jgi:hypothetical protein
MKKTALTLGAVVMLALATALFAQPSAAKGGASHLGAWQLVATKYGDVKEFTDYPKTHQRIKMFTASHFTWMDYDATTKKILSSAGGSYSLQNAVYIETVEFVGEGMASYLDKKQEFTIKIEGDKLFQSGHLSDGLNIEEIWKRVD